jgi:hypothetical protein
LARNATLKNVTLEKEICFWEMLDLVLGNWISFLEKWFYLKCLINV